MVYARCLATEVRTASGTCVDSTTYCTTVCGTSGGTFSSSTGTCQCNNVVPLAQICDADCRASAPTMTCNSKGDIVVYDPSTGTKHSVTPASLGTVTSHDMR